MRHRIFIGTDQKSKNCFKILKILSVFKAELMYVTPHSFEKYIITFVDIKL